MSWFSHYLPEERIGIEELAAMLQLKERPLLRRLLRSGLRCSRSDDGARLFVVRELEAWLETRRDHRDAVRRRRLQMELLASVARATARGLLYTEKTMRLGQLPSSGFVYFIQDSRQAIKIGFSDNPVRRVIEHSKDRLIRKVLLIIPGELYLERELHAMCFDFRIDGELEWFRPHQKLLKFIRWLDADVERVVGARKI